MTSRNNTNHCPVVSVLKRRYRSAIALNNIAVHLLERNCFAEAVECFEGAAIPLMQTTLLAVPCCSTLVCLDAANGGEEYVQRAMRHLDANPAKRSVLLVQVVTVTPDGSLVCGELPDQTGPSQSCLDSILQTVPCSSAAFPIRIEENLLLEEPSVFRNEEAAPTAAASVSLDRPMPLVLQLAIMSHNLAIARLGQSKQSGRRRESRALQRLAAGLLHSSYAVFLKSLHTDDSRTTNIPCLMICLLNSLIAVLKESSKLARATYFYHCLCEVRSLALEQQNVAVDRLTRYSGASRAAAAA